ncbi:unnamed protein product [Didymodactylos carnosus]|uniref:Uncharacterized protein n=1 Tax=Didymodactylos carnosus TaxID=1234261 RepID=A0A814VET4_9BILA|nr:unnamed protein product [Didymodactylos carnosus]CAF3951455.1 unnamed protein product [Didymodactylos carnosus]
MKYFYLLTAIKDQQQSTQLQQATPSASLASGLMQLFVDQSDRPTDDDGDNSDNDYYADAHNITDFEYRYQSDITVFSLCENLIELCSNLRIADVKQDFFESIQTCVTSSLDVLYDIVHRDKVNDRDRPILTTNMDTQSVEDSLVQSSVETPVKAVANAPYLFDDENDEFCNEPQLFESNPNTISEAVLGASTHDVFARLLEWLMITLSDGNIVRVTHAYDKLQHFGDMLTHYRTFFSRLKTVDTLSVVYSSKRSGNYIILKDFGIYLKLILQNLLDDSGVVSIVELPPLTILSQQQQQSNMENDLLIKTSTLIRSEIECSNNKSGISDKTSSLNLLNWHDYVEHVPILLLNFIKLLTMNKIDYKEFIEQSTTMNLKVEAIPCDQGRQLKQLSTCFDLIACKDKSKFNPKQLLLAISLYKITGSRRAIELLNKFGLVSSYDSVQRTLTTVSEKEYNSDGLPSRVLKNSFLIKVVDKCDLLINSLDGKRSIHIVNQLYIHPNPTVEKDSDFEFDKENLSSNQTKIKTKDTTWSLADVTNRSSHQTTQSTINFGPANFQLLDNTMSTVFHDNLFVYALSHIDKLKNEPSKYPLLSGYMYLYLTMKERPPSIFLYGNPIDMPATASNAPAAISKLTKNEFIDNKYQEKAVLVVDEAIYASLLKEKEKDSTNNPEPQYDDIFLLPGDWHFMKNIFGILGLEYLFQVLYDSTVVNGIIGVYNFDHTFRAYILLFTSLYTLQIEEFIDENAQNVMELTIIVNQLKDTLPNLNDENKKQELYDAFLNSCEILHLMSVMKDFEHWRRKKCETKVMFKYYDYVLHSLLVPIFTLYIATRTNNFSVRNKQWRYFIPFCFAFNHTNYS